MKNFKVVVPLVLVVVIGLGIYFYQAHQTQGYDSSRSALMDLYIISATPKGDYEMSGENSDLNQISITFNRPMYSLGDNPQLKSGQVVVTPQLDCKWKWISENTVACEDVKFNKAMKYSVLVKAGFKSLENIKLEDDYAFEFVVNRPKINSANVIFDKGEIVISLAGTPAIKPESFDIGLTCLKKDIKVSSPVYDVKKKKYMIEVQDKKNFVEAHFCDLNIDKGLATESGQEKSELDFSQQITIPQYIRNINKPFQVIAIKCRGRIYEENIYSNEHTCSSRDQIEFIFNRGIKGKELKDFVLKIQGDEFEDLDSDYTKEDYKDEQLYSSITVHKKFVLGKKYKIDLDKNLQSENGEKLSVHSSIEIFPINSPPSFNLKYRSVVKEWHGPHLIPYESQNVSGFDLKWKHMSDPLSIVDYLRKKNTKGLYQLHKYIDSPLENKSIEIPYIADKGEVYPLDLDELNKKPGLFYLYYTNPLLKESIEKSYRTYEEERRNRYNYLDKKITPYQFDYNSDVLVTNLGIHAKVGYFNTLVWVFSIQTGQPLAGVTVKLYGPDNNNAMTASTNELGIAELPGRKSFTNAKGKSDYYIIAQKEDDISYVSHDYTFNSGMSPWSFNIARVYLEENSTDVIAEIVTDRPIYQPGEDVSMKIFVRQWDLKQLKVLESSHRELEIEIRDSQYEEILKEKIRLNDYGTAVVAFKLKQDAKTGNYRVRLKSPHGKSWIYPRTFAVQEFRTANFEVEVTANKKLYKKNDHLELKAKASYLFGGAVKEAKGKLFVTHKEKYFEPKQSEFAQFEFNIEQRNQYFSRYYNSLKTTPILKKDFKLNARGEITEKIDLSVHSLNYGNITVEAAITDEHGADIANRINVDYISEKNFLGIKLDKWSYDVAEPIKPKLILLDGQSKVIKGEQVKLELIRREYNVVRRLGTGNYYYYDNEVKEIKVGECELTTKQNSAACSLQPDQAGSYSIVATAKNLKTQISTYVYGGKGYISWGHYNHDRIDIIPEKDNYEVGETAKFLIKSPYPRAKALITVERHGILTKEVIDIQSGAYVYELKIADKSYGPGVFLSVVLIQGRTSDKVEGELDLGKPSFKIGYSGIRVLDKSKELEITVSIDKSEYKPAAEVSGEIQLLDSSKNVVKGEVAIAVVDQAILQMVSSYKDKYNLRDTFYAKPQLDVSNSQLLNTLLGRRTYGRKGGTPGGGGGAMDIRDNFLPIAYWNPQAETDKEGKVKFKFTAPDNLTKWRVIAIAIDKETRVGYGDNTFRVNKKLMLTPALPNFLAVGDILSGKFVVHNRQDQKVNIKYSISSEQLDIATKQGELELDKDTKGSFFSKITALKKGEADITVKAIAATENDAVVAKIPVIPVGQEIINALFLTSQEKELKRKYVFKDIGDKGQRELNLLFSTTILQGLDQSFEYVIRYPYGCWEQRLSKALFLGQYQNLKPWLTEFKTDIDVSKAINELYDMAYKYQSDNGGMKYYPSDFNFTSRYLSYFTAYAFMLLEEANYKIDAKIKKNLQNYIETELNNSSWQSWWDRTARTEMKIHMLYVLHNYFKVNVLNQTKSYIAQLDSLGLSAKSSLLMLIHNYPELSSHEEKVLQSLLNHIKLRDRVAEIVDGYSEYKYMLHTEGKVYCQVTTALMKVKPSLEHIPKLINKISLIRNQGRWSNTQENIMCFNALHDYAKIYEKKIPDMQIKAFLGDQEIGQAEFKSRSKDVVKMEVPQDKLDDRGEIKIKKTGTGRYYLSLLQKYRTKEIPDNVLSKGFKIEKGIFLYTQTGEWKKLDQKKISVKRGDILKIKLKVQVDTYRYNVGIHDPLAGAFEPINTALATASRAAGALAKAVNGTEDKYDYFNSFYRSNGFSQVDMRLQAVQFYADRMAPGNYSAEYMVQVIATGEFHMNPTKVEEMYYPEIYGMTKMRKVLSHEK